MPGGTAFGAATDYLVAQLAPLAAAAVADAIVIDANTNDEHSDSEIWIGRTAPQDLRSGSGPRGNPVLGTRRVDEEWTIPGFIDCRREGTDQKTSRDAAVLLWDVVCRLVATDPSLGGNLSSPWYATVPLVQVEYPDPPQTAMSRTVFMFGVHVKNRVLYS